jgi:tRNA G18 (ribose-2'-O)-methylase SpoU
MSFSELLNSTLPDHLLSPFSKAKQNYNEKFFVADGEKTVLRLLQSGLEIKSILCLEKYYKKYHHLFKARGLGEETIVVASKPEMEKLVGYSVHQGFMALAQRAEYLPWQELPSPMVILNQVGDAENVGAIVRTALAFGIQSLLFDRGSCTPYIRRAVRVSMGYVFQMNIAYSENLAETLKAYQASGIEIFGSSARMQGEQKAQNLFNLRFPKKFALILGSEGYGMAQEVAALCGNVLHIPMQNSVSSLNITSSLAAILTASKISQTT